MKDLLGKVVTIKTSGGLEIVGLVSDFVSDRLMVSKPRVVVVSDKELALVPYTFTSDGDVPMNPALFLSVVETGEPARADYLRAVGHIAE